MWKPDYLNFDYIFEDPFTTLLCIRETITDMGDVFVFSNELIFLFSSLLINVFRSCRQYLLYRPNGNTVFVCQKAEPVQCVTECRGSNKSKAKTP